jgi:methyl-accepting chemotaxis protein
MKLTVAKELALLIVVAVFGLIGLGMLGFSQINRVFESTNYSNVNTVPSISELDNAFTELSKMRAQLWQHISLTDKVKMAEIKPLMESERTKVDLALKTYETAKRSDVNFRAAALKGLRFAHG